MQVAASSFLTSPGCLYKAVKTAMKEHDIQQGEGSKKIWKFFMTFAIKSLIDLIDLTLAVEDANTKLVDIVAVADFGVDTTGQ